MKTIIAVYGAAQKGKTETLKIVASILRNCPTFELIKEEQVNGIGIRLVCKVNGKKIAVETLGDHEDDNCNIIFCASRTRGDTVNSINEIVEQWGYSLIWTSTYEIVEGKEKQRTIVNKLKAHQLSDLLKALDLL